MRLTLTAAMLLAFSVVALAVAATHPSKPKIVLVLMDNFGWEEIYRGSIGEKS